MEKLRVGLLGAGGFGHIHLAGYKNNTNCQIVSVASRTFEHAKIAADKFKILNMYADNQWVDMVENDQLDLISICTPNYLHAPMILEAIKNGIHILCEKPICISIKELKVIEKKLKNSRLIFFTSFQKRYIGWYQKLKELLENNVLGSIVFVRYTLTHYGPYKSWKPLSDEKWFFDLSKAGGGVLINLGVHGVDLLRYLLGDFDIINGCSFGNSCYNIESEDNAHLLFRFKNGSQGMLTTSWCNEPSETLEIFGRKGSIRLDLSLKNPFSFTPNKLQKNPYIQKIISHKSSGMTPQQKLINHFVKCVNEKKQDHPNFEDGKRALEFVLDAYSFK